MPRSIELLSFVASLLAITVNWYDSEPHDMHTVNWYDSEPHDMHTVNWYDSEPHYMHTVNWYDSEPHDMHKMNQSSKRSSALALQTWADLC